MFFYLMFLNIYYWEKQRSQNLSEKQISPKEMLKKCTSLEEQMVQNVYFGIIIFSCLSSRKQFLRFFFNHFVREIKGFYQSSLRNEVDSRDIMNVSPNIWKNWDTVL